MGKTLSKFYGNKLVFSGMDNRQEFTKSKNRAYREKSATLGMDCSRSEEPNSSECYAFLFSLKIFSLPPHLIYFIYK